MAGSDPQLALTSQLVLLWVAFLEMATLCHFKDLLWAEGVVPSEGIFGLAEYPLHLWTEKKLQLRVGGGTPKMAAERPMAITHQAAEIQGCLGAAVPQTAGGRVAEQEWRN